MKTPKAKNKSKSELLQNSKVVAAQTAAEARGAILLYKNDRLTVKGLKAIDQAIQREHIAPLQSDINDFITHLNDTYNVKIGEDYNFVWDTCELTPIPAPPKEEAPANETPSPDPEAV